MDTNVSLGEIERRAYRATFDDGIYEFLWGCIFLLFAWIPILESIGISRFYCYPLILLLAPIPWLGKRYITIPRLGAVEFGEKRKARNRNTILIAIIAIGLMLPLVTVMIIAGLPPGFTWKIIAFMVAPIAAIGVFLMDYPRMYIYAILLLYSIIGTEFLLPYIGAPFVKLLTFGVSGGLIIGYGLFLLYRFLKKYPKPKEETSGARGE
jgi:hypothetical protein